MGADLQVSCAAEHQRSHPGSACSIAAWGARAWRIQFIGIGRHRSGHAHSHANNSSTTNSLCAHTHRVGVEFRQGGAEVVGLNALRFKPRLFYKNIGIEARTQLTLQVRLHAMLGKGCACTCIMGACAGCSCAHAPEHGASGMCYSATNMRICPCAGAQAAAL